MRKLWLFTALLVIAFTANAQDSDSSSNPTTKGTWMFSGNTSISFSSAKTKSEYDGDDLDQDVTLTTFSFMPDVSYFVIDNLAVGISANLSTSKWDFDGGDSKSNSISIIPNATYFFNTGSSFSPYLGAGAGLMSLSNGDDDIDKYSGLVIAGRGGVAYFLSNSVSINFGLDVASSSLKNKEDDNYKEKTFAIGVGVGFSVFL